MNEHDIQREAVKVLRDKGYRVIVTSNNRRVRSATRGLPDVLVAVGRGLWVGLEFKAQKGALTEEQTRLMREGNIHVCRSSVEALAAIQFAERQLR